MKDRPKHIQFNVDFQRNFETINNSGFVKGRARIAYAGKNRNGSLISNEAFENAMDSLALIPIVGNWIQEKNNFGGHDIAFEEIGNELKIVDKTRPYGVIPQNHNAQWVDVEDEYGNVKKYIECDIILWKERYESPIQKIIDGGVNQSMEIVVKDGEWESNYEYFNIKDFYYSALCLLGRDLDNNSNNVEPCFEQAEVTVYQYNFDKEEFKFEFNLMIQELKKSLTEGGDSVIDETVEFQEEVIEETKEDVLETDETIEVEETPIKDDYAKLQEEFANLQVELSQIQESYASLKEEVISLREFKSIKDQELYELQLAQEKQEKIDFINNEFAHISEDIRNEFISKVDDYDSIESLEADICVYVVKNKVKFSKAKNENKQIKIGVEQNESIIKISPYGDLFNK